MPGITISNPTASNPSIFTKASASTVRVRCVPTFFDTGVTQLNAGTYDYTNGGLFQVVNGQTFNGVLNPEANYGDFDRVFINTSIATILAGQQSYAYATVNKRGSPVIIKKGEDHCRS